MGYTSVSTVNGLNGIDRNLKIDNCLSHPQIIPNIYYPKKRSGTYLADEFSPHPNTPIPSKPILIK